MIVIIARTQWSNLSLHLHMTCLQLVTLCNTLTCRLSLIHIVGIGAALTGLVTAESL